MLKSVFLLQNIWQVSIAGDDDFARSFPTENNLFNFINGNDSKVQHL